MPKPQITKEILGTDETALLMNTSVLNDAEQVNRRTQEITLKLNGKLG
ncbi:MAG: hypothetical protein OXC92_05345 [Flavobacteriaceae bacterium]|nr:hypothetical protein [Flavobacteriaceae bacterium]